QFDYQNTRLSAKGVIYPQSERMFIYSVDKNDPEAFIMKEAPKEYPPQVVVGIRSCDAHALKLVNVNFDNPEYKDPWWVRRYQATILVGLGCNEPCSTCFCTLAGGGPFNRDVLDVLLYDLGEKFLAEAVSEKGEQLLSTLSGGKEPEASDQEKARDLEKRAIEGMPEALSVELLREKVLLDLFNAPFWEDVAFACINCGTCTYLCPTCWCFDIQDEVYKKEGDRIRNWDSCMFPLFTLHGSGHNPREQKFQRVRQRFMHKLKYYPDKYKNGIQCSGCGRCVQFCPVNIDIRQVLELMKNF
ncbi:MAG TPA: 4Fe-4S ferredoxin, partial [Desulfobacterales bacterium]|nr:4Fe-4S ferredoxin [Desulfobacterales bacterium]